MKKLLLFVIACTLGLFSTVNAQTTVTIGDGSAGEIYSPPIDLYYSNAISQQIFPASSLGIPSGSVISKIAFKRSGGSNPTRSWSIYMQNSEADTFVYPEYTASSKSVESSDKVYSGTFTVPSEANAWVSFDLTETFTYEGGDLIITVMDNTGSSGGDHWWVNSYNLGRSIHGGRDAAYEEGKDYSFNQSYTYTSDIQLTYTAAEGGEGGETPDPTPEPEPTPTIPSHPASMTATANGQNSITLTWEAVDGATSYNIYSTAAGNVPAVTATEYTYEGLTAGTYYCFEVTAENAAGESYDSAYGCATTEEATEEPGEGGEGGEETGEIYIVEVGADKNPNTYNNYNLPVYDYQAYSVSQQIYTAADLGAVGDIHSIAFKLGNQTSAVTRQYEVYLATTELSYYGDYNFIAVTEADKVFDGNVEISGVQDSWLTINFDKEFPYSGGNLVLTVYDKTGVALPNGYHTFYKYATAGMNGLNKKGSSPYDMSNMGTGGSFYYINQIQLGMELDPTPTVPQGLEATTTSSSEIALSWGAVFVADSYNVYAGTELVANVEGTTYTVEGLEAATEYCYTVTAVNELGESAASAEACATTLMLAPSAPANLAVASVGEMSVSLTWDEVATAESYKVYQGETLVATGVTATEYTVEGLASETEYCFTVSAVNNGGESAKSEQACGTTLEFTGCYVYFTLTDSYGDGWNSNTLTVSYGTASQTLTLSSGLKTGTHIVPIPQNAVVTLTYTVVGSYSYPGENGFVVAYESGKEILSVDQGSLSATTTFDAFTVDCGPTAPDAPVVTATNTTSTTIVLAMEVFGAEKYNVYQGEELVASVTETTYTVEGLEASTEYCFSVTAENSLGESEATEVCATTKMYAPAAPANLTATTTGYFTIALAWEASATAESYNIYQGENLVATNVTATEYTVEGLTHDTEYCFTVKAVNNGGESVASESACDTTEEYDGCFVNFTLSDQWNDSWDGDYLVVAYDTVTEQLECPKNSSPTYTLPIPQGAEVTATYTKTSNYPQEKGIVITYESGKEILNIAQGSLSETTSWEFVVDCTPEAPGIATVSAEATGDETVVLTMAAVGADSFNIYVGEELVATTTENVYTVEGLNPETEYCFTVEAVNEVGTSEELSEAACATTYKEGTALVQIGEGTDSYVQTSPVNEFYSYSISQTVYTAEEIGVGAGVIKSISYNQYSGNNNTRNLSVFMKNVGEDVNLTSAWETLTEDLLVYDTTFTFGTSGWTEIKLQKDFVYEGGNLLVCVLDKTGNYAYNYDMFYTYLTGSTIRSIYAGYSQTIDPYNINVAKNGLYNNNYNAVAPQVKFVIEPEPGEEPVVPEPTVPAAPVVEADTVTETTVTLVWNVVENATSYNVYMDSLLVENVTDTVYTVTELTSDSTYDFTVTAVADTLESEASNVVTVTTLAEETDEPTDPDTPADTVVVLAAPVVEADTVTETTVTLVWNVVENATSYNVYMDTLLVENVTDTVYTVTELTSDSTYNFTVTAVADTLESEASNVVTVTTLKAEEPGGDEPTNPDTPVDPEQPADTVELVLTYVATSTTDSTVTLTWNSVDSATSYNVYMDTTLVASVTDTVYTVTGLAADSTYSFTVAALNDTVVLATSNAVEVTTLPAETEDPEQPVDPETPADSVVLAAPVVVADTVTETTVTLSWNAVEGATSYNVYMDTVLVKNVTDTVYTVTELTAETTYSFTVTAVADTLESVASNVVTVTTLKSEGIVENAAAFSIYPNPAVDRVVIATESTIESVSIYTLTGVMIYSEVDFNNNTINVSDFASGVYFIKVRTDNGEAVQRFIKK